VLILVVIKQAEETVQANINARGLDHVEVQGVQANSARVKFATNIAV
jgi:hypothetical protein